MGFRYEEEFRELQPGDVAGAALLYGRHLPETLTAKPTIAAHNPTAIHSAHASQTLGNQSPSRTSSTQHSGHCSTGSTASEWQIWSH